MLDGIVRPPLALPFVLGSYGSATPWSPRDLLPLLEALPERAGWTVCAFGPAEAACIAGALALGGHARVGFESNLVLPGGAPAPGNAARVANAASLAAALGRPLAGRAEAERILAPRALEEAAQ